MSDGLDLLRIDAATCFRLDPDDRIERTNDPDGSPGPRLWFAACRSGAVARFRDDLGEATVAAILDLVATEPPFAGEVRAPAHTERYLELLSPVPRWSYGPIYVLPRGGAPTRTAHG